MTDRDVMKLADVICCAGYDWNIFIDECHENGEDPQFSYDEFLAQEVRVICAECEVEFQEEI